MTRQQKRYYDREIRKCALGMQAITEMKNPDLVNHNQYEFLRYKAERLKERYNAKDNAESMEK